MALHLSDSSRVRMAANGNYALVGTRSHRFQPPRAHLEVANHFKPSGAHNISANYATGIRSRRGTVTAIAITGNQLPRGCHVASSTALAGKPLQAFQRGALPVRLLGRRAPVRRTGRSAVAVAVSANLFTRMYRIVTSFFNGIVASFEDPEKLLDRVAEEMLEDMTRMRQATAQVMASQRQMVTKQKSLQAGADQWLSRAELAVSRGQDDLAREALKRRKVLQEDADRLNEQVMLQTNALEQLQANTRVLEGKLAEARSKKETLKARAASAKTSLALQEMIGGLQMRSGSSWAAFEKMEEKVAQLEAQAQTATALVAPDSLERQFAALEGDTGVDAELAALKQYQHQHRGAPSPLPPSPSPPLTGRPLRDVFDPLERELEDLRRRARE
ncbi:hypothetical protein Vafri_15 [Volvox africanus]|nr:hypothetical protein Vafri_15 [Volvox africanus]